MSKHLVFNSSIGSMKPNSLIEKDTACPFCNRGALTNVFETDGPIIWLKNKYPTLEDTFQTLIIETEECDAELSTYSKDHLYKVISFGLDRWKSLIESQKYKSVIFFKNHGPYSGGSIRHPHMQIVGLNDLDYMEFIDEQQFEGIKIGEKNGVEFSISTFPRIGFFEFNVIMNNENTIKEFADYIQIAAHYILNHFNRYCNSYNLFFYNINDKLAAKIIPRFPTSPLFIGYSIPQVSNRLNDVVEKVKKIYL